MKFLSTPIGSWVKVFAIAVFGAYLVELESGRSLFSWDWGMTENLLRLGVIATIPVIINWFDTHDKRYGNTNNR